MVRASLLLAAMCCFVSAAGLLFLSWRPPARQYLTAAPRVHDLGDVRQRESLTAHFVLKNESNRNLKIVATPTDCSCTVTEIGAKQLVPGATTQLTVALEIGNARGKLSRDVQVQYAVDGNGPILALPLQVGANVIPDFIVIPERLEFNAQSRGDAIVQFSPTSKNIFGIKSVESSHSALRADVLQPVGDQEEWRLRVSFDPQYWANQTQANAWILVGTDNPHEPTYRLAVLVVP